MPKSVPFKSAPVIFSGRQRQRAFTIVEVMVAITLLAVLLGLAAPSYVQMKEKRELTQGAEQVFAFMNATQGIASRSNDVVTVSYSRTNDNEWCIGATTGNTACDCAETTPTDADFCAIDDRVMRITNDHTGNKNLMQGIQGDGAYSFDPIRGLLMNLNDSPQMVFRSPGGDFQLQLNLNATGHATMCSANSEHKVPGYDPCPVEDDEETEG